MADKEYGLYNTEIFWELAVGEHAWTFFEFDKLIDKMEELALV